MRLFTRYNRLNIGATIAIFLAGSCVYFFMLRYVLISQVDESLETEQEEVTQYVKEHGRLPEIVATSDQQIRYLKAAAPHAPRYKTLRFYRQGIKVRNRELSFTIPVSGVLYEVDVTESLEGTAILLQLIIFVTVGMIALILTVIYLINRTVLRRLWHPFYTTIEQVGGYSLSGHTALKLEETAIDEFSLLNRSLNGMTARAEKDYQSLREFTTHAAHEMQTPLAIIRTKLDLLMQEDVSGAYVQQVADIESSVRKLTRLHQSLLLLTKVERGYFKLDDRVTLDKLIGDKCAELTEFIKAKDIRMDVRLAQVTISFNTHLAEILVGNLINNAIRYNKAGGRIGIALEEGSLTVSNTSYLPALDHSRIYTHFYRHPETKADGNGLGLSIVKQLCGLAGYPISYHYLNGLHIFTVSWMQKPGAGSV